MSVVSLVLHNLSIQNQEIALNALNINQTQGRREFVLERLPSVIVTVANQTVNLTDPSIDKFLFVTNQAIQLPPTNRYVVLNLDTLLDRASSYESFTSYLYQVLAPATHPFQQMGSPLTVTSVSHEDRPPNLAP